MTRSDQIDTLAAALSAAQGEMSCASRDAQGQSRGGRYRYATLASVRDASVARMSAHGLAIIQLPRVEWGDDVIICVETVLTHASGQWIASELRMACAARDAQAIGSAITYARRYAWTAMLGLATDDDDDASAAMPAARSHAAPKSRETALESAIEEIDREEHPAIDKVAQSHIRELAELPRDSFLRPALAALYLDRRDQYELHRGAARTAIRQALIAVAREAGLDGLPALQGAAELVARARALALTMEETR